MSGIRCFVAVELPLSMQGEIRRIEEQIATEGLRLVKPELVHVTLKFLGDVPEGKVQRVTEALSHVKMAPFPARVKGMGAFPGRTVRVVWLGLEGEFEELYGKVESVLAPFGFEREARGFSPHVTLGRVARPGPQINRQISAKMAVLSSTDLGSFTVDRFFLKKSTLTRGGPIYDNLASFSL
ncbi:RNA 2',3'-cyclic phosphodiesterase [uncultured archaeon]|nr:RNA 2',3'-cyclic phosphodiesterase [uncultured archaeon]